MFETLQAKRPLKLTFYRKLLLPLSMMDDPGGMQKMETAFKDTSVLPPISGGSLDWEDPTQAQANTKKRKRPPIKSDIETP
jgi:hypothetical protein